MLVCGLQLSAALVQPLEMSGVRCSHELDVSVSVCGCERRQLSHKVISGSACVNLCVCVCVCVCVCGNAVMHVVMCVSVCVCEWKQLYHNDIRSVWKLVCVCVCVCVVMRECMW